MLPLAVLVLAVLALALNLGGIAAALRAELFAAWQGAAHAAALRPGWAIGAEAFWLGLVGVAAILLMRHGLAWTAALVLIAMLGGFWFGWFLFAARHLALDAASPAVGLALVLAAAIAAHLSAIARNRAALHAAFAESLPRASIEKIARDPALLKVDGEIRDTTYLVCGVRGLADVTAAFRDDPRAYTAAIQKMLTPLMDQALAHGGTIDRLTADGFAAFWNAPLADHEHALHACEAANGMEIKPGHIYLAPGDYHFEVVREGAGFAARLSQTPPQNFCRPSVDPLFHSVAQIFGADSCAIMLTGMGSDGCGGAKAIAAAGSPVIAQDEATSVVWGMPGAVAQAGICSAILPLPKIAGHVASLFESTAP